MSFPIFQQNNLETVLTNCLIYSLSKHLSSKKGSRTANTGNSLELDVLNFIQNVPWIYKTSEQNGPQTKIFEIDLRQGCESYERNDG